MKPEPIRRRTQRAFLKSRVSTKMFRRSDFRNARSVRQAIRNPEARESACKLQVDFIGGEPNPAPIAKTKHDLQWAKAKHVCRLDMEDIRKAKELGISPQSLKKQARPKSVLETAGERMDWRVIRKTFWTENLHRSELSIGQTKPDMNASPVRHKTRTFTAANGKTIRSIESDF